MALQRLSETHYTETIGKKAPLMNEKLNFSIFERNRDRWEIFVWSEIFSRAGDDASKRRQILRGFLKFREYKNP